MNLVPIGRCTSQSRRGASTSAARAPGRPAPGVPARLGCQAGRSRRRADPATSSSGIVDACVRCHQGLIPFLGPVGGSSGHTSAWVGGAPEGGPLGTARWGCRVASIWRPPTVGGGRDCERRGPPTLPPAQHRSITDAETVGDLGVVCPRAAIVRTCDGPLGCCQVGWLGSSRRGALRTATMSTTPRVSELVSWWCGRAVGSSIASSSQPGAAGATWTWTQPRVSGRAGGHRESVVDLLQTSRQRSSVTRCPVPLRACGCWGRRRPQLVVTPPHGHQGLDSSDRSYART